MGAGGVAFGRNSLEPLLIVGALPRGGNHLLRGLLDGHPQLLVPPDEDYFVRHLLRSPIRHFEGCMVSGAAAPGFYRRMQKNGHLERVNDGGAKNSFGTEGSLDLDRYYDHVRAHHRRFSKDGLIRTHLDALAAALRSKMPGEHRMKVLFSALQSTRGDIPSIGRRLSKLYTVKGVFVFRDPRAHFGSKLGRKPNAALRRFCRRLNRYWRQVERFEARYGPVLRVRFESLVLKTEETMREVCEFAGIEFTRHAAESTQGGLATFSNSSYDSVQGIDPRALTRYRDKVTPEAIRYIETHCRPELFWDPDAIGREGAAPPAGGLALAGSPK